MALPVEQLGLSSVHLRCLDGNLGQVIAHLKESPGSLDLAASDGATPLMLACLMADYDLVQFLVVNKSADITRTDRNQRKASDYAGQNEFALQERAKYVNTGLGREHRRAAKNRPEILGLLENTARRRIAKIHHRKGGGSGFHEFRLAPVGSKIGVFGLIDTIDTKVPLPDIKTLGFIMPHDEDLPIRTAFDFGRDSEDATVKGPAYYASFCWKTDSERHPQVVDSELWGWVAHNLVAPLFGHVFTRGRDNGNMVPEPEHHGRVKACHVEVLLSTFYAFSVTESLIEKTPGQKEEDYVRKQASCLSQVRSMNLGARQRMTIYIDSHPCHSCRDYVDALGVITGLSFEIMGGCWMRPSPSDTPEKGARFAPAVSRADFIDQADKTMAIRLSDPSLMDGFRYTPIRGEKAATPPGR